LTRRYGFPLWQHHVAEDDVGLFPPGEFESEPAILRAQRRMFLKPLHGQHVPARLGLAFDHENFKALPSRLVKMWRNGRSSAFASSRKACEGTVVVGGRAQCVDQAPAETL